MSKVMSTKTLLEIIIDMYEQKLQFLPHDICATIIEYLNRLACEDINKKINGKTILHYACELLDPDMIKHILNKNPQISNINDYMDILEEEICDYYWSSLAMWNYNTCKQLLENY